MKTLKITRMFVSRMTVTTKLLKICLSKILIDDEILGVEKRCPFAFFLGGLFIYIYIYISSDDDIINDDVIKTQ